MNRDDLVHALREAIRGRKDLRLAILFGSQARGTATAASDVDVAIDAPGADILGLASELGGRLDRDVDVVPLEDAGVPLLEQLIKDGIVVHEARPGAGAAWRARALTTLELDRPWFQRMRDAYLRHLAARRT